MTGGGWVGDLAVTLLTAFGCLTLGAAVVRLTSPRWLLLRVLSMAAVDVLMLAVGEGVLIVVAAGAITITAVDRLLHPQPIDDVGVGLAVSAVASLINLAVGFLLLRAGRQKSRASREVRRSRPSCRRPT